ncbi:MAG: PaaI family thioesterase [Myxococcota bacterium]|nr:PaaI family thioesterase [Myxococcota bacterium]
MNAPSDSAPTSYPPDPHLLRDLNLWVEEEREGYRAGLEITPWLCQRGGVRAGVLATLVDVIGGAQATRSVQPNWVATCDLMLHLFAFPAQGSVLARSRLIRAGRSTVVIEVDLEDAAASSIGLATLTFSVLEARGDKQRTNPPGFPGRTTFSSQGPALDRPILDRLEISPSRENSEQLEFACSSYNRNSLDAIQGGALALLVEGAAESAGSKLGLCRVRDLEIHYLALGRTGPIQARPRILRRDADSALVRVEIVDGGAEDRTVVIATAELGKSAEAP